MYSHSEDIHNLKSAKIIWPLIFQIYKPSSILDIGCGIGTWLKAAKDLGIYDIFGIDSNLVNQGLLSKYIDDNEFLGHDLKLPFRLNRKFDLVVCLEVAEHLPVSSADILIQTLVSHSNVILFSAAIPGQGGQNHINEQWPEYWANFFLNHNYVFLDIVRPLIWENSSIDFWYRQNLFLVVNADHSLAKLHSSSYQRLVHPELLQSILIQNEKKIKSLNQQLNIHPLKRWIKSLFY